MSAAIAALTGFLGYKGAKKQADAIAAQNAILKEQYEWEKSKEVPGVSGAKDVIANASQFQPFVDAAGQQGIAGANIAQQYLGNVPVYQQAGQAGVQDYLGLSGWRQNPDGTLSKTNQYDAHRRLANQYADDHWRGQEQVVRDEANRQAQEKDWGLARQQGRFGALSSQKARGQAYINQAREQALMDARAKSQDVGYQRVQSELQRQQGLAGNLAALGSTGLSQAQQASQLGSGAINQAIQAPFQPFQQYGQTVSAQPTAHYNPNSYGTASDPLATGVGLGLQAWDTIKGGS